MIRRLTVTHFKGFAKFSVNFDKLAVLIGPNNAGKSTLIAALRSSALMLRHAQRRKPELLEDAGSETFQWIYRFDGDPFDVGLDNLRHDFRPGDSIVQLDFEEPAMRLSAVWPEEGLSHFLLIDPASGWQPNSPSQLRALGDLLGVIPSLVPVEDVEQRLEPDYVARNIGGRLSSRHFRNQVLLLEQMANLFGGDYGDYVEYCREWAPDIELEFPRVRRAEKGYELDLFYNEGTGPRELVWAGDGFQVWLQLLLQIFRLRKYATIVLDEPEVYLHPDLQRRLIRLLEGLPGQVILATHSPEIASEVSEEELVLVDRSQDHGMFPKEMGPDGEGDLGLGTRLNFALAKSLRARLTLFVEGKDLICRGKGPDSS